jgi:hypothetical protein
LERSKELTVRSSEQSVDPESGEALEKVVAYLEPDHWSGSGAERFWAKPLGEDLYELRNTPWYAYDINWGDVVRCDGMSDAGHPIVREIVEVGGHQTLRVFFAQGASEADRERVLAQLNALGATYENSGNKLYSVDLEPEVAVEPVLDFLALEEEHEILDWETGWTFKAE